MKKDTSLLFAEGKVFISEDLVPLVKFLEGIEIEINMMMDIDKKMSKIREDCQSLLSFILFLSNKLKENNIDFHYELKTADSIAENLKDERPLRTELIVLFAYLETLKSIYLAYEYKTNDKVKLINLSKEKNSDFVNKFCLSKENLWVVNNEERSKKINPKSLISLRNLLTHFFSVDGGIQVSHEKLATQTRKIEEKLGGLVKFISPEDLYEISKGACLILLRKMSDDSSSRIDFVERIEHVKTLIKDNGSIVIKSEQIANI